MINFEQAVEEEISPKTLAPIAPDDPAVKLSDQMLKKLDEARDHHLNDLQQLSDQIAEIKTEITQRTDVIKKAVSEHFNLIAEARSFKSQVENRLNTLRNGDPG